MWSRFLSPPGIAAPGGDFLCAAPNHGTAFILVFVLALLLGLLLAGLRLEWGLLPGKMIEIVREADLNHILLSAELVRHPLAVIHWDGREVSEMSSYYTLVHKTVKCPLWLDDVQITAKYRYSDDPGSPYMARFVCASCEVVENLHLPREKQDKRLALYRFCDAKPCPFLADFQPEIDVRKP